MSHQTPIAVIGMGCRLPGGAHSPEALWEMLSEGRSGWGEVPAERWNWKSFYHPYNEAKESLNSKSGYFLNQDIGAFDAKFFNIASYEAHAMDPQQRILLETTYEALENAGIPLESIKGSNTCVYVGIYARDYDRMGFKDLPQITKLHITGTGEAVVSNRISYLFDLKGASVTVDTGCSGSMVALHQACQNLRTGESSMAIVGGTQLLLHPDQAVAMSMVGMVNPHGRCYVFDSRGSGYARGEGVGTIILKRLDDAIAAGDPIHAVIRNSGLNQDGKTAGISLPSPDAQAALMRWVYSTADVDPRNTVYVEAHGTVRLAVLVYLFADSDILYRELRLVGWTLSSSQKQTLTKSETGDNAEISSINEVFCEEAKRKSDIYVGSIKSNIGHLEASSGIAGIIKGIMIVKKGLIPPNIDLETPKPSLKLDERKIKIPLQLTPLPEPEQPGPSRVSLNSFGYGGTNAHVILEPSGSSTEYSTPQATSNHINGNLEDNGLINGVNEHRNGTSSDELVTNGAIQAGLPQLFVLNAASEKSLLESAKNIQDWISNGGLDKYQLADLSYTLNVRRSLLPFKTSLVASTKDELMSALQPSNIRATKLPHSVSVVFVFTGQGAQWHAMGRELIKLPGRFKDSISKSDRLIQSFGCQWSLIEELYKDEQTTRVADSELSQPLTTAIQIALVDLLATFGIAPQCVCGHSSGEIGAAYAAGALTHEAAIEIAYRRGLCSTAAKKANSVKGSMLAVGIGEKEVLPYVQQTTKGLVTVACVNSPESTTISGDEAAIDELSEVLTGLGIFNRKLKVDTAYHSHHMKKIADQYVQSIQHVVTGVPQPGVTFYSSVTAHKKTSDFGPAYWTENLVSKVRFSEALQLLAEDIARSKQSTNVANIFAEIGPHGALSGPIRQILSKLNTRSFKFSYVSALSRNKHAVQSVLELSGKFVECGCPVQFENVLVLNGSDEQWKTISDLSPYPWDHSLSYWYESRMSRDHRLREFPYHDLLGLLDVASSIHEPRWRYHINVDSSPWLRDHVVDGFMIFPGAGYLCMAIEAMKQLVQLRKVPGDISNYILRNVVLSKPIIVPDQRPDSFTPDVEVQITLSRMRTSDGSRWESFRIFSYSPEGSGTWHEHCSGLVSVEMASKVDEVEGTREEEFLASSYRETFDAIRQASNTELDPKKFYDDLKETGNNFGPTFSAITEIQLGKREGCAKVAVPDIPACMPRQFLQPHVIHPATLDAINQLSVVLFKKECINAPLMATFFKEIIISAEITSTPADELLVALNIEPEGRRSASGSTFVFQKKEDSDLSLVLHATGLQLKAVGEALSEDEQTPFHRKMSYRMQWQPDVDLMSQTQLQDILTSTTQSRTAMQQPLAVVSEELGVVEKQTVEQKLALLERAAAIYLRDALSQLPEDFAGKPAPHLTKLLEWMRVFHKSEISNEMLKGLTTVDEDIVLQKALLAGIEGLMLSRIGLNLPAIINNQIEASELMHEDGLLSKFYTEGLFAQNYQHTIEYVKSLAFKKPHMKILEVGAGLGELTLPLLRALDRPEGLMVGRYEFTDVTSKLFEQAKPLLQEWSSRLDFKTLDLDLDPTDQEFSAGTYDLIIATNSLSCTSSTSTTLSYIHKLLKPSGKLVSIELTRATAALTTVLGTLPGWWAAEDERQDGPLLSETQWHSALVQNAFSGVDIATNELDGPKSRTSMIVSTSLDSESIEHDAPSARVHILASESASPLFQRLAEELSTALQELGIESIISAWNFQESFDLDTTYVVLDDMDHPLLLDPSPEEFEQLKTLFISSRSLLWINAQSSVSTEGTAAKGLVNGMARVARRENEGIKFITLDVQEGIVDFGPELIKTVLEIATACFWPTSESQRSNEHEYAICNGLVHIPRVQPDTKFNEWIDQAVGSDRLDICPYQEEGRALKLHVETPGLLSSLRFVDDDSITADLSPEEVEIEARAYGINFKDVFIALGQMLPGINMVGEVAGVVTAVGSSMQSRYKVGDRVAGVGAQPFTSRARVKGLMACSLPDSISFASGASIPIIFMTAYHCIFEVARLQKGQTILIHAGSGGVGQAAIQFAQHIGAEIFATVGSTAKKQLLIDEYNIPESHVFSTRSRTFKHGVLRLTKNKGVDVVLNSLSGEWLNDSWECVAPLGTFVEIGKSDIYKRSHLSMVPFDRSVTFAAVDLVVLFETQMERMNEEFKKVMSMFETGILAPVSPVTTYPVSKIEEAFRLIASRKHTGKVVVEAEPGATVKAVLGRPAPLQLDPAGSYVVAGGLGDLGKRICRLLATHGAKHVVTLSRRELSQDDRQVFENEINELGCMLHIVKCDITDKTSVQQAEGYCRENLPPVKGVIHAGMVLRDHPIELMTPEDYTQATKPKTQGTINLHSSLQSPDLDFFITLSSITCIIGKTGQANYSAGNAFQDAFAHAHAGKSHTQYISLNLGAIDGSEAITSLPVRQQELMRQGAILVKFEELFKLLEYSMGPQARRDNCVQTITGFDRQSMETVQDTFGLSNPLFSQVPYLSEQQNSGDGSSDKVDTEKAIRNAASISEAEEIITHAIAEKFALFMDRALEDVNLDQSLAAFGLDSLVSIELKNWMVRTFQVTLQTSEIADALSVVALAKTITSRSKLISDKLRGITTESEQPEDVPMQTEERSTEEEKIQPNHSFECCRYAKDLPRQPLMDLDEALDMVLSSTRHFASGVEYDNIKQAVLNFRDPASTGRQLYAQLQAQANDPAVESWIADLVTDALFLKKRFPLVPMSSFFASHHDNPTPQGQAERAALIATTAFRFKEAVEAGSLEPHWYFHIPSCTSSWDWLFNTIREPHLDIDQMKKYPGNDYCVVLRRGHVFSVPLKAGNEVVPYARIKATFDGILEKVQDEGVWTGILTNDNRDSWATIRERLISMNSANAEYIRVIEQAAFVLCLDEGAPTTGPEHVRKAFLGDGFNRWFDKGLQFTVCENGSSGYIVEHSKIDGLTVHRMNEWIHEAIRGHTPETQANGSNGALPAIQLTEYTLTTTPEIDTHMQTLRQEHIQVTSAREYGYTTLKHFGKNLLAAHGCPIKSVFDVTIQLASKLYFGHNPASWEPMSMAHFHKGRTEIFQGVLASVGQFCATAVDDNISTLDKREMLIHAANEYTAGLQVCGKGSNYFRLLTVLETMWPAGQPLAPLFTDPVWLRTYPRFIMSGLTDGGSLDSAFALIDPEGVWVCYSIWEEEARFSVVGPTGQVARFEKALDEASVIVKGLVESK
ncbi:Highly reducing polyketide synthase sdnO [Penicillium riverlandense]|uniref:Highly reducing polyketide synthase sdnO n=1 Tax=Penicillium riverlandense TaxID=1903569 RepID=UPI0025483693|nr:Highly reducing polyketide synthase sdnO [Penicillium riverlandense]KAJ5833041.1 Highly reducing polyketide synthase sdnO [Penicillium riverlandense]